MLQQVNITGIQFNCYVMLCNVRNSYVDCPARGNLVIKYRSEKKSRWPLPITFINIRISYILDNSFQIVYHKTVSCVFALGY